MRRGEKSAAISKLDFYESHSNIVLARKQEQFTSVARVSIAEMHTFPLKEVSVESLKTFR